MATKLLVTGDWHWRGNNPRARTDDFPTALKAKLSEALYIAWQRKVDAVVVSGDIFDSPNTSLGVIAELAHLLQREASVPILTVPGNHDEFGANLETIARTPYGLLYRLGFIWDVQELPFEAHITPHQKLVVTGHGYDAETDREIAQYLLPAVAGVQIPVDATWVHVVHGMILEQSPSFELRHTLLSEIAAHDNAPDVLICGHEHIGWGVRRVEKCDGKTMLAINPGALCRLTAHPAEIERTIQVCLLTIHDDGQREIELIPLKSARPGHEVLSREHLEAQAAKEERVAAFLALLAEEGETRFLEVREIIEDIARREAIPREVVDEALRRIGVAREAVA